MIDSNVMILRTLYCTVLFITSSSFFPWGAGVRAQTSEVVAEGVKGIAAIAANGQWLAYGEKSGTIVVTELPAREKRIILQSSYQYVMNLAFSSDGTKLIAVFLRGEVEVWDWNQGKLLVSRKDKDFDSTVEPSPRVAGLSLDGQYVAITRVDNFLRDPYRLKMILKRSESGKTVGTFPIRTRALRVKLLESGDIIASNHEGEVQRLAPNGAREEVRIPGAKKISSLSVTTDERLIAVVHSEKTIAIVEAKPGQIKWQYENAIRGFTSVAFSPSGHLLAAATGGTIEVLEVSSGKLLGTFKGHKPDMLVRSMVFSEKYSQLFTASTDGTLRSWSLK